MKNKYILLLIDQLLLFSNAVFAQNTFQKSFGGQGILNVTSIVQTFDRNYILGGGGKNNSNGSSEVSLMKIDSSGNILWSKLYGTPNLEQCYSLAQSSDSGFIIGGTIKVDTFDYHMLLTRTDKNGVLQWTKSIGTTNASNTGINDDGYANSIAITKDSGFILCGPGYNVASYDVYVVKTDASGNKLWSATYGTDDDFENASSIKNTYDGGFIIAGNVLINGLDPNHALILKIDSSGNMQWSKYINGLYHSWASDIALTTDSGFVVVGMGASIFDGKSKVLLLKLSKSGAIEWSKEFGSTGSLYANKIIITPTNSYVLNCANYNAGVSGSVLISTDSLGNILWSKEYVDTVDQSINAMVNTNNGDLFLAGGISNSGNFYWDAYITKIEGNGNRICGTRIFNPSVESIPLSAINLGVRHSINDSVHNVEFDTISITETVDSICSVSGIEEQKTNENCLLVFPNPAYENLTIKLSCYQTGEISIVNLLGQIVFSERINAEITNVDLSKFSVGMYVVRWSSEEEDDRTKISVIK